jgi:hypothetical protein
MKRGIWLVLVACGASCSSRDQSLGETRPSPQPTIVPDPGPNPTPDPNPDPAPNPDPNPSPNPDPTPTVAPCEDTSKHAKIGHCTPLSQCRGPSITRVGYECEGDSVCCDDLVGCSAPGCGGSGGNAMSQGGDASAGVGGQP